MKFLIMTALVLSSALSIASSESLNIQKTDKGTFKVVVQAAGETTSKAYIPFASEILLQKRAENEAKEIVKTEAHEFCADLVGSDNTIVQIKSVDSRITNIGSKSDNGLMLMCGSTNAGSYCAGNVLVEFSCK